MSPSRGGWSEVGNGLEELFEPRRVDAEDACAAGVVSHEHADVDERLDVEGDHGSLDAKRSHGVHLPAWIGRVVVDQVDAQLRAERLGGLVHAHGRLDCKRKAFRHLGIVPRRVVAMGDHLSETLDNPRLTTQDCSRVDRDIPPLVREYPVPNQRPSPLRGETPEATTGQPSAGTPGLQATDGGPVHVTPRTGAAVPNREPLARLNEGARKHAVDAVLDLLVVRTANQSTAGRRISVMRDLTLPRARTTPTNRVDRHECQSSPSHLQGPDVSFPLSEVPS